MSHLGRIHTPVPSAAATPFPFPPAFVAMLPPDVTRLERDVRRSFYASPEGHLSPRAALGASLEILRKEECPPTWVSEVISQVQSQVARSSFEPLADWSEARLVGLFKRLFRASWTIQTCAEMHRSQWRESAPECGQSCVTALIVQEFLGCKIRRGSLQGSNYDLYFLNELSGGRMLELTRSQFHPAVQVIPGKEVERVTLLDAFHPDHDYARAAKVPERYALLKGQFLMAVAAMALAASRQLKNPEFD